MNLITITHFLPIAQNYLKIKKNSRLSKENEEKVSTDKDGRQMVKKIRDEESGFDTGDNMTNEVNPTTESQEDSSDIHEDSERETKELLEAK